MRNYEYYVISNSNLKDSMKYLLYRGGIQCQQVSQPALLVKVANAII